jgi:hypothetical protein
MQIKRTRTKDIAHLNIHNFAFENVKTFNYLGSILNAYNKMNPLNTELNPIRHLLALLGAHHILHVSRIRVNIEIAESIA